MNCPPSKPELNWLGYGRERPVLVGGCLYRPIGDDSTLNKQPVNSFSLGLQNPTLSFINRPLQTSYGRNGVHEFVLGPYTQNEDLSLAQILAETEFYVVDLETS